MGPRTAYWVERTCGEMSSSLSAIRQASEGRRDHRAPGPSV
jgi:hypothetical protein